MSDKLPLIMPDESFSDRAKNWLDKVWQERLDKHKANPNCTCRIIIRSKIHEPEKDET